LLLALAAVDSHPGNHIGLLLHLVDLGLAAVDESNCLRE